MTSHNAQILAHMKAGRAITPLDALERFGCLRLSGRIYDLRADGHRIDSTMIDVGDGKRVAEYRLLHTKDATNA